MVSWSCLRSPIKFSQNHRFKIQECPFIKNSAFNMSSRQMASDHHHHHHLEVNVSRFQWNKFKDLLHFYVMLGVLPIIGVVMCANIFIGPAQLSEIPADYEPKYWEYHKHPISRFIARYLHHSPQQDYEKYLHFLYEENEKALIRNLEWKIRAMMSERNDYQAYAYRPVYGKYLRVSKETAEELEKLRGTN